MRSDVTVLISEEQREMILSLAVAVVREICQDFAGEEWNCLVCHHGSGDGSHHCSVGKMESALNNIGVYAREPEWGPGKDVVSWEEVEMYF